MHGVGMVVSVLIEYSLEHVLDKRFIVFDILYVSPAPTTLTGSL